LPQIRGFFFLLAHEDRAFAGAFAQAGEFRAAHRSLAPDFDQTVVEIKVPALFIFPHQKLFPSLIARCGRSDKLCA
jgi:hypothetical protein